jgi:hypothetical protein
MRTRRPSLTSRAVETLPVFGVLGIGVAGVFIAMNVLVNAAPLAVNFNSPSPSTSVAPTLLGSPTLLPFATDTSIATPVASASLPDFRPTVVNSTISAADPNGIWRVYLLYPAFRAGTTPWADAMNAQITTEMQTRVTQWEQGPASNRQVVGKVNSFTGTYSTELLTPSLASFTLGWVDDATAAPPASGVETINYDLSTGQLIAFDDLFTDTDAALQIMSGVAATQLVDVLGAAYDGPTVADGASPSRTNFINWALTAGGMKITFAEHQVTSRAGVLPAVVVPWSSLRSVMVGSGPVAQLAGF